MVGYPSCFLRSPFFGSLFLLLFGIGYSIGSRFYMGRNPAFGDATRLFRTEFPGVIVLGLSAFGNDGFRPAVLDADAADQANGCVAD